MLQRVWLDWAVKSALTWYFALFLLDLSEFPLSSFAFFFLKATSYSLIDIHKIFLNSQYFLFKGHNYKVHVTNSWKTHWKYKYIEHYVLSWIWYSQWKYMRFVFKAACNKIAVLSLMICMKLRKILNLLDFSIRIYKIEF